MVLKKKKMNRRGFLMAAGALSSVDPITLLAHLLLQKKYGIATAATNSDKRYVLIQQPGAPARWVFDLFVDPEKSSKFIRNPHMATQYTAANGRNVGLAYNLINIDGNWVPPIWNANLPAPNGQTRKLRSLLANMMHIRGIDTGNAAHSFCRKLHMQPLGAVTSVTSLTAAGGGTPIPAVNIRTTDYAYADKEGLLPVTLSSNGNIISELMEAFVPTPTDASFEAKELEMRAELDAALSELNNSLAEKPGLKASKFAAESAKSLMRRNFPDFDAEWTRLINKYQDLVNRSLRGTAYPGVNNRPVGITGSRDKKYQSDSKIETQADLRDLITNNTTVASLSSNFAALEFILVNDLSRSVAVGIGGLLGLNSSVTKKQQVDEHQNGSMISLLLDTYLYGAVGSCLLELVHILKDADIFDKTVIDMGSEFNRRPRNTEVGSDHGFEGASVAMYTGQIKNGPIIIGDILSEDGHKVYSGTWGKGASNPGLAGVKLNAGHFASTVATLLEAPSPISAASSLVERNSKGEIISRLPKGKTT